MAGENRQLEFLKHNPAGELPALQLDNGIVIAETIPICEYLEEIFPNLRCLVRHPNSVLLIVGSRII